MFSSTRTLQQEAERARQERKRRKAQEAKERKARQGREDARLLRVKRAKDHSLSALRPKESDTDSLSRAPSLEKKEETLSPSDVTAPANPRRLLLQVRRHQRALQDVDPQYNSRARRRPQRLSAEERYNLQEEADEMLRRYGPLQDYVRSALRAACEAIRTEGHGLTDQVWWCRFFEILHAARWFLRDAPERKRVLLREELRSWPEVQRRERLLVRAAQAKPGYKAAQASKKRRDRASWTDEERARHNEKTALRMKRLRARRAKASGVASGHEARESRPGVARAGWADEDVKMLRSA